VRRLVLLALLLTTGCVASRSQPAPPTPPIPPIPPDAGPLANAAPSGDATPAAAVLPPLERQAPQTSRKGLYVLAQAHGEVRGKHPLPLRDLVFAGPRLIDATSGNATFRWPEGAPLRAAAGLEPSALARSADGQRLALVGADGSVVISAEPGTVLWRGGPATGATAAAFADRDTIFFAASDGRLRRLHFDARQHASLVTAAGGGAPQLGVATSPDGRQVAVAAVDATVRLYDAQALGLEAELGGHHDQVTAVAYAPDGNTLASASWDGTALLFDLHDLTALPRELLGHLGRVHDVAFSPDGSRVVTAAGDGHLRLFDAASGALVADWMAHVGGVRCVAFSPDGAIIASGGEDLAVRAFTLDGQPALGLAPLAGRVEAIASSGDGHRLAWLADLGVLFWRDAGGPIRSLRVHPGLATALALDRSGDLVITGGHDKTVVAWTLPAGIRGKSWVAGRWVNGATLMPDGRVLLATSRWAPFIWDLASGKASGLGAHRQRVNAVGVSQDGSLAVSCASDRTARVWTVEDGKQQAIASERAKVWGCAISPDGTTFVDAIDDGRVRAYTLADKGQPRLTELATHTGAARGLAVSPDGDRLASMGDDGLAIIYDLRKLVELDRIDLGPYADGPASLAFTPAGHLLLGTARGQVLDYQER
jgi:WD40 repeat protein